MKCKLLSAWTALALFTGALTASEPAGMPGGSSGVSLGRPKNARGSHASPLLLPPRGLEAGEVATCSSNSLDSFDSSQAGDWVVRGQGPSQPLLGQPSRPSHTPMVGTSPQEAFNCGVATGPPPTNTGPLLSSSTPPWAMPHSTTGSEFGWNWFIPTWTFQSDHCFDNFISPMTNPFFFEDPRSLTELRPIFLYQKTPDSNPISSGGNIFGYYLQGRLALNERWSIVMPKLGLITLPDLSAPVLQPSETGFAELMIGPKFTFWRDDYANIIAAAGIHFEVAVGDSKVFQDTGTWGMTPYLSVAFEFYQDWHFQASAGYRIAFDDERSEAVFVSLHLDYNFFRIIYPFVELHWWHYTKAGTVAPFGFEGMDLINLGSTLVKGNDLLNIAFGVRFKILGENVQAGVAVEFPLLSQKDLMDYRLSADLIFRY